MSTSAATRVAASFNLLKRSFDCFRIEKFEKYCCERETMSLGYQRRIDLNTSMQSNEHRKDGSVDSTGGDAIRFRLRGVAHITPPRGGATARTPCRGPAMRSCRSRTAQAGYA